MFSLKEKVAVITGARRGIGKGIAERLSYAGANVVISDIDQEDCEGASSEIAENHGVQTLAVKCDVSTKDEVDNLITKTIEKFGRIDIMVNNAGIVKLDSLTEFKEEDWNSVLDINLKGAFLCSQAAAKEMMKKNYGKIISIASKAGLVAYPNGSAYCASKAGIVNLTREMAVELAGRRINVNAVAPGLVETPMTKFVTEDKEKLKQTLAAIPWNRAGQPSDIANAVHFLASDEADYITGHTLAVDGGGTVQ